MLIRPTIAFLAALTFFDDVQQGCFLGMERAAEDYDVNLICMGQNARHLPFADTGFFDIVQKKFRFMRAPLIDAVITQSSSYKGLLTKAQEAEVQKTLATLPFLDLSAYAKEKDMPPFEQGYRALEQLLFTQKLRAAKPLHIRTDFRQELRQNWSPFSTYVCDALTQVALAFAAVTNGNQLRSALHTAMSALHIPSIILALSDNATTDLETCNIELVLPELYETVRTKLPYRITDASFIPAVFFPQGKRYTLTLEILRYDGRYFGFSLVQTNTQQLSVCTNMCALMSHALYQLYKKENRLKEHSMLLNTQALKSILTARQSASPPYTSKHMSERHIMTYLLDHLNEMTNLNKMASDLGVSKSKLERQVRQLTGKSVQVLHEHLKMELAKNMLVEGRLTLAEIAERLGFQNGNYFSAVFKKNYGISPRAWANKQ